LSGRRNLIPPAQGGWDTESRSTAMGLDGRERNLVGDKALVRIACFIRSIILLGTDGYIGEGFEISSVGRVMKMVSVMRLLTYWIK